jgi:hypothetical protein
MSLTSFIIDAAASVDDGSVITLIGSLTGVATGGAYKVPVKFSYPAGGSPIKNASIVEPWNNTHIEAFGTYAASPNDQGPQLMVGQFGAKMGVTEMCTEQGWCGVSFEWNKDVLDQYLADGVFPSLSGQPGTIPFDGTWVIGDGPDGWEIMADASLFCRNPMAYIVDGGGFLVGKDNPPTSVFTCLFGYSQNGTAVRGFADGMFNSALAGPHPGAVACDAIICGANGAISRALNSDPGQLYHAYSVVDGETPASEGQVAVVNTETDVLAAQGWRARPAAPLGHYNVYEVAGMSHVSPDGAPFGGYIVPLVNQLSWIASMNHRPIYAAIAEALYQKVVNAVDMPPDAVMEGTAHDRGDAFFTVTPRGRPQIFGTSTEVFVPELGKDGNVKGGIRLPHIETHLPSGACIGAPLGIHRGFNTLRSILPRQSAADWLLTANAAAEFPPIHRNIAHQVSIQGFSLWYPPSVVARLYPDADACKYAALIASAADYAYQQRWILSTDKDRYINTAGGLNKQDLINFVQPYEVGPLF